MNQHMYHLPPAQRFVRDPESLHVNMRKLKLQTLKKYVRLNRIQTSSRAQTHQELAKVVASHFCSTLQQVPTNQNGISKKSTYFLNISLSSFISLCKLKKNGFFTKIRRKRHHSVHSLDFSSLSIN